MARAIYVPQAGGFISFKDNASDADIVSYLQTKYPSAPAPVQGAAPEPSDAPGAFGSGVYSGIAALQATGGKAAEGLGFEDFSKYLFDASRASQAYAEKYKPEVADISQVGGIGDLASYAGSSIAQSAPESAVGIGGAYAGGAAGAALGSIVPGVGTAVGGIVGGVVGSALSMLPFYVGHNIQRQAQEQGKSLEETNALIATGAGTPQAILDTAFDVLVARKLPGSQALLGVARKGFLRGIAVAAGQGALAESLTEPAQQAIEIAQANPEKLLEFGPDVQRELINAAAAGGITGGILGGGFGGVEAYSRKQAEAPQRQLRQDILNESVQNTEKVRLGQIAQAAENLRQTGVEGTVDVEQSEFDGLPVFNIKAPGGDIIARFDDQDGRAEDNAIAAVNLYAKNTGVKVEPNIVKKEPEAVAETDVPEEAVPEDPEKVIIPTPKISPTPIETPPATIEMPRAVEAIPEEMPIGAVELPIEEQRYIEPEAVTPTTAQAAPEAGRIEMRPSATVEQLTDLKAELFGKPLNVREMTPEQLSTYEAERDKRFPPAPETVYYSAGQAPGTSATVQPIEATIPEREAGLTAADVTPKSLREAYAMGPRVKAPTEEVSQKFKKIYNDLASRVSAIAPPDVTVGLREFIDTAGPGVLVKGQHNKDSSGGQTKNVIDLATGIYDPGMTTDELLRNLLDVLNHEVIHALRGNGLIRPSEWRILSRAVAEANVPGKKYTYLDKAQAVYNESMSSAYADPDAVIEEAVAELYKDWVRNGKAPVQTRGLLNRITEFFRRIFRTLRDNKYEDVFQAIETGEVRGRESMAPTEAGTRFSAAPVYDPKKSNSDWETGGAPPPGISSVNNTGGSPFRISQRRPTSVRAVGASLNNNLLVDVASMKLEPGVFEHNINIVNSYPGFPVRAGETPEQTLKRFKKHVVDNLLWLHDKMDPVLRQRAKLWYDGARKITDRLAAQYNLPDTTVAAVLAGLSPQKDWFQNVSLAERLIDIVMTKRDVPFDDAMFDYAMTLPAVAQYAPMLGAMRGMSLNDIKSPNFESFLARKHNEVLAGVFNADQATQIVRGDTTLAKAIFVRVYDEMNNPRSYNIITPEGDRGSISTTGRGDPSNVAWGSFTEIGKGVNAIDDGTKESIDALLGDKHKIRNFYNNIISPNSKDGSVTIDTHAVAAALMRALAGKSVEVHHNFGTSVKGMTHRTRNSSITGVHGMYAIYADAYREAAKLRGVLPREMQSITWEAVRGLYKPRFKGQGKNVQAIDDIWRLHSDGKITANEARKRVLALADPGAAGINSPFWKDTPSSVVYGVGGPALNTGGVRQVGLRQAADRTGGGGTGPVSASVKGTRPGVKFSAAPALNSEEFKRWFRNSKIVNRDGSPKVVYHGTQGKFKAFETTQSELGSHFGTANQANDFVQTPESAMAREDWEEDVRFTGRTDQIFPVYLSMQNPLRMKDTGKWIPSAIAKRLHLEGLITLEESKAISALPLNTPAQIKATQNLMKARGIDGIVYLNRYEGFKPKTDPTQFSIDAKDLSDADFKAKYPEAEDSYLIFDPVQAKSVFNEFEEGAATSPRFSAAPLPTYIQSQNQNLFTEPPKLSFAETAFNYLFGYTPGSKERMRAAIRANIVDKTAFVTLLEQKLNLQDTGNFERRVADYSATAQLTQSRRASHLTASSMMMGPPEINFATPGDILSATVKIRESQDNLMKVFETMMQPGPVDPATGKATDLRDMFKTYATAIRGRDLRAKGLPVPREITPQYVNEALSFIPREYPQVVEAYNMYQRVNKELLTAARDAGIISTAELGRLTRDMNYYGFYREVFQEELVPTSTTKTAGEFKLREYKGSQEGGLINDPMYVIIRNTQFWMESIAKNLAAVKSFDVARRSGEAQLLGRGQSPDLSQGFQKDIMYFKENGVLKRFAVKDPLLVTALGSDDRVVLGKAIDILGMPASILRETVTRDPAFMVANLLRDTVSSWITSGEDIKPFIGTAKGMVSALKQSASFKDLMGRGVVGSYDMAMMEPAQIASTIRRRSMPKNIHTMASAEGAIGAIQSLWDRLGALSEASDAATRIAVYDAARAQGLSEAEAAMRAVEIMDFSRRGASHLLNIMTKMVPFLNARIQGLDVLYQAAAAGKRFVMGQSLGERDSNLGKKFLVRGLMLAAISVALEMANSDDEDYKQLDSYIKDSNLLIPLKAFGLPGEYIAIPKPFEAGLLFSTFPQHFYKMYAGQASTRETANLFFGQFASTFGVNPLPQIMIPPIEIITNHDFYTGLPLISEGKLRLDPSLQYDSRTSTIAMMISEIPFIYDVNTGEFRGPSPIAVDQIISGYTGPVGSYIAMALGTAMSGFDAGPERMPTEISQYPVIRRFFVDAEAKNPAVVTQAYELFRIVDEANRTFSRLRQANDAEALLDYYEEKKDVLAYKKYIMKLVDRLNKISAYERQIERDKTMTDEEKLEAKRNIRELRIRVASRVGEINKALGR